MLFLLDEIASWNLPDSIQHGSLQNPDDQPEILTEVSSLVSTRPSWLQTLTHSSPILGLRVAFPAPSSKQDIGGWLEGRISGTALKYRQVPGVLSEVTLAVMRISSPAKDPARRPGEEKEVRGCAKHTGSRL
jgi:hypothetical protein